MRMIIQFHRGCEIIRTTHVNEAMPNLTVGQTICFDHPSTSKCVNGTITRISHVVFLSEEPPLTYVDVEVE